MRFLLMLFLLTLPLVGQSKVVKKPKPPTTKQAAEKPFIVNMRARAMRGDAKAQFDLGVNYHFGQGVLQNDVEAVAWYRKAAVRGYAKAQYNLGVCLDFGRGVPQDHAEAAKWYREAAEQGHAKAQFNLGVGYKYGQGVAQDFMEAYAWLSLAAEGGEAKALDSREEVVKKLSPLNLERAQTRERVLREEIQPRKLPQERKKGLRVRPRHK